MGFLSFFKCLFLASKLSLLLNNLSTNATAGHSLINVHDVDSDRWPFVFGLLFQSDPSLILSFLCPLHFVLTTSLRSRSHRVPVLASPHRSLLGNRDEVGLRWLRPPARPAGENCVPGCWSFIDPPLFWSLVVESEDSAPSSVKSSPLHTCWLEYVLVVEEGIRPLLVVVIVDVVVVVWNPP